VRDEAGAVHRIAGIAEDITEQRLAQQALKDSHERLRALAMKLENAKEAEHRRLARELHDQVGQSLAGLGINLCLVRNQMPAERDAKIKERLDEAIQLVDQIGGRIRDVMADLHPTILDDYGLLAAIRGYCEKYTLRTGIAAEVKADDISLRLSPDVEISLFRIAQEGLTNAAKHSQARQVIITVKKTAGNIRMTIADDGRGFEIASREDSRNEPTWGLLTMRERATAIGGLMRVDSAPGKGTTIIIEVES
jgi:two-component system sensor histidine kinase UhpB